MTPSKPKMLFVDDRSKRIHYAFEQLGKLYEVRIAANVPEALRALATEEWDIVSLDHDLDGHDFTPTDSPSSAMRILDYIIDSGWPREKKMPEFIIHSSNPFAANRMMNRFLNAGYRSIARVIDYHEIVVEQ